MKNLNTLSNTLSKESLENLKKAKNFKTTKLKTGDREKVRTEKLSFNKLSNLWKKNSDSESMVNLFVDNKLPKRIQNTISKMINHCEDGLTILDHDLDMHDKVDKVLESKRVFIRQAFHLMVKDDEILQELVNADLEIN